MERVTAWEQAVLDRTREHDAASPRDLTLDPSNQLEDDLALVASHADDELGARHRPRRLEHDVEDDRLALLHRVGVALESCADHPRVEVDALAGGGGQPRLL